MGKGGGASGSCDVDERIGVGGADEVEDDGLELGLDCNMDEEVLNDDAGGRCREGVELEDDDIGARRRWRISVDVEGKEAAVMTPDNDLGNVLDSDIVQFLTQTTVWMRSRQ